MFVLFEGLDLSGKSTLCRELGSALGWPVRHNTLLPPGLSAPYERAQKAHRDQSATIAEVGQMFHDALLDEIKRYKGDGEPCIQDSTILLRSIAYHSGLRNSDLATQFATILPLHPKPALAFLCRPSREIRLRRLEGRISRGNETPEDFMVRDDPEAFSHMESTIESLAAEHFDMQILDTSGLEDLDARRDLVAGLVERISRLPHKTATTNSHDDRS